LTETEAICNFVCMSTKTIAVNSGVYEKLAGEKREGESFSRLLARLLEEVGAAHTGRVILRGLADLPKLTEEDGDVMLAVIRESREEELWTEHDLR